MKRSKHSLSNYKLLSCDLGELVPIGMTEVLAGDSIQQSTNALIRAAPLLSPVMHPVNVSISHWFVPNRIIWDDWENFITGGPDGMDASVYPTIAMPASTGAAVGSLADYLGVVPGVADLAVSALPFRAYALIFNEWYRDQDLVTPLTIDTTSGPDTTTNTVLQNAAWEKDYFTTSRPWEQKGPSITVPLGTEAPVKGLATTMGNFSDTLGAGWIETGTTGVPPGSDWQAMSLASQLALQGTNGTPDLLRVRADLSNASAVTVNVLREALALQRYEEARARYGSRYTEYLRYLGVRSSDARLQRPEYLGGGKETIQFSEVLQTSEGTDPVGTLRGHGISSMRSNRYRRFFEEHGWVITLLTARPKTIYASGLARHWNRRTKEDFWQKELQHIGQQPILNKEVRAAHASPDGTFGYQDRYDEYRRMFSSIAGEFRTTLDYWHFARQFSSSPALNADFIKCVPTEEPFAIPSEDVLQIMARHSIQARRLVAGTGTSFIY
ncbi:MAG: major capsid protein [Arizlama microvirus]|nr:MAG: major capsid protein [Arizlama microvirus]